MHDALQLQEPPRSTCTDASTDVSRAFKSDLFTKTGDTINFTTFSQHQERTEGIHDTMAILNTLESGNYQVHTNGISTYMIQASRCADRALSRSTRVLVTNIRLINSICPTSGLTMIYEATGELTHLLQVLKGLSSSEQSSVT